MKCARRDTCGRDSPPHSAESGLKAKNNEMEELMKSITPLITSSLSGTNSTTPKLIQIRPTAECDGYLSHRYEERRPPPENRKLYCQSESSTSAINNRDRLRMVFQSKKSFKPSACLERDSNVEHGVIASMKRKREASEATTVAPSDAKRPNTRVEDNDVEILHCNVRPAKPRQKRRGKAKALNELKKMSKKLIDMTKDTWRPPVKACPQVSNPRFDPSKPPQMNFADLYEHKRKPAFPAMGVQQKERSHSCLSSTNEFSNISVHSALPSRQGLRPIVIDGQNVGRAHAKERHSSTLLSARGIDICVRFFVNRGHKDVVVFLPQFRMSSKHCLDRDVMLRLESENYLRFTPSSSVNGYYANSYDDRYIVQYAALTGGVIVSNDEFRDLMHLGPESKLTIQNRRLQFTFVKDILMFPEDPQGRRGVSLDQLLTF